MTNMTYAMAIDSAINGNITDEVIEKLEALKAQLAKRGSSKTLTKTQKANIEVKAVIADVMADLDKNVTVTELIADERLAGMTCQKASALLRQMIADGLVGKEKEGKKMLYFLI